MALPTIRKPTVAPNRAMARDVYPVVADQWAASIGPFTEDLIVAISWMGQQVTDVADYKDQAAASVKAAAQSVADAAAQVKLATDQAQASKVSADAAAASLASSKVVQQAVEASAGLPGGGPDGGVLRIKLDGSKQKEWWVPVINRVGDLVVAPSLPDSSFVLDDSRYAQTQWPELFAKIGAIGFDPMADNSRVNAAPVSSVAGTNSINAAVFGQYAETVIAVDNNARVIDITSGAGTVQYTHPNGYAFYDIATDGKGNFVACGQSGAFAFSRNNGVSWALCSVPSGTSGYTWSSISTDGNGTWYAFTTGSAGSPVLKSTDNGYTWQNITFASMGLPANYAWQLAYDGVGTWYANAPQGIYDIYKSTNGGVTWTKTTTPPNGVNVLTNGGYAPTSVTMSRPAARGAMVAFTSTTSSTQASTTYYYTLFVYSYDGGSTWQWLLMGTIQSGSGYNGGAVTFAGDNTAVVNEVGNGYRYWVIKNLNAGRKQVTVSLMPVTGISGTTFRPILTNGLGTFSIISGNSVKRVAPVYDPKTLFYVPKFPEAPYPFQSYVKARLLV